ncbi:hypothetical protein ACHAPX_008474 [Trichoderma viride]
MLIKKVAFARIILLSSAVAAAATQLLARDTTAVLNDITQQIGPKVATLNEHINAFPASGLSGAETINKDAAALIETVKTATGHVKDAGSFGVVSGTQVLAQLQAQVPPVLAALTHIQEKASSWDAIEGPKLAGKDLEAGKQAFSDYFNAIIAAEPFLLKAGAIAVKAQLMGAFDYTISVYS